MDASDILISKSGGLTSAESMAKQLPMLIVDPIPGQESRNAAIIVERGAGMFALDHHNLQYKLGRIINEPDLLHQLAEGTKALAKPHAAADIIHDAYRRFVNTGPNE
jgi:processive 1,2-diacylglycerol beta-glucosyltransferase